MQEVLVLLLLLSHPIINEVMANPRGPEATSGDKNEFVEIYNPDSVAASLLNFFISDGDEIDTLTLFPDSSILSLYPGVILDSYEIPPHGYALILDREYMDSSDVSQPYNIPAGTIILTTNDNDIGNGLSNNDPLYLISPSWDTLDTYGTPANPRDSIPINPPDGISVERIDPFSPDIESNWGLSRDTTGSTPGRRNSLTVWHDLGILRVSHDTAISGAQFHLHVWIKNFGIYPTDSFTVSLIDGFSSTQTLFIHLNRGDTTGVELTTPEITEPYINLLVSVHIEHDENPANDTVRLFIPVSLSPVVINEVMYDDTVEWIEIYNNTTSQIQLAGFHVKDASGHVSAPAPQIALNAHEYFVFAADSATFVERFPGVTNFIELDNFPTLNNNYESVVLLDGANNVVDSLRYSSSWGGAHGISLERVSPGVSTNLRENWGSSRASAGATPGRINSISNFHESRDLILLSSKVFKRDSGNFVIKLNAEPGEKVLLYVFDIRGRIVRKLIDGEKGIYIVRWDGTDMWGRKVGSGLYIIYCATETRKEKAVIMVR